jgi:hypothetical protein
MDYNATAAQLRLLDELLAEFEKIDSERIASPTRFRIGAIRAIIEKKREEL